MFVGPSETDLHCHSTASDGSLPPAEVVTRAAAAGVKRLALTDHDTIAGLAEAQCAAAKAGVELITGVELSLECLGKPVHIVGLGFNPENPKLQSGLSQLQSIRRDRAERIAKKLEKQGLKDALFKAEALANGAQITRPHFAQLLIEEGLAKDFGQAFKRYLKAGKPGYVAIEWPNIRSGIDWIHAAGGKAVFAHPLAYKVTASWRQRLLAEFAECGGDALEVSCGAATSADYEISTKDALKYGFSGSMGSDFHTPEQAWRPLGKLRALPSSITPVWETF